ncbi:MAG: tRNA-dihydrouridine synthase family protein [Bacteroidaceae bacterium]|nr:tRNA-dihydrouridine synthase family protein [Bacteroidaceae bacterium]
MKSIYFAPLQGYTDDVYRRVHNELIGGVKLYYTPFVRVEAGSIRSKDIRDISPANNKNVPVVPQIIFNSRKEFEYLVGRLLELGYKEIDLNMGCPFPLQTKHKRGAGILAHNDIISDIVEGIKRYSDVRFSVKMRLGWEKPQEAEKVVQLLNGVELQHITLHPRTGIQQYKGNIDIDAFARVYSLSDNPVVYNGDILSIEDIYNIERRFPDVKGFMIGRGLLGCPSLAKEYNEGVVWSREEHIALMLNMHSALIKEYSLFLKGETQILNKMRTFWEYSEQLLTRKPYKKVLKSGNLKNYLLAVTELKNLY